MAITAADAPVIGFLVLFLALASYRAYRMTRGASASPARLWGITIVFLVLFALSLLGDAFVFPAWFLLVQVLLVAVSAVLTTGFVRRGVVVTGDAARGWVYRLGFEVPAIYLSLFLVRIVVDFALLGGPVGFGPSGSSGAPAVTGWSFYVLGAVDALFAVSAGLILGRTLGITLAVGDRASAPSTPGPLP